MTINSATGIISRWHSTAVSNHFIFHDRREEIAPYLQAVEEIQQMINSSVSEDERKEAESMIQIAMSQLAGEFRNILKVNAKSNSSLNPNTNYTESTTMTDSASSSYEVYEDDYMNSNTMNTDAINDLRCIAVRMNSSGFLHDCLKLYVSERKSVIDAAFHRLNLEKMSRNSARRLEWGVLESKIKIWIKSAKICFKYYFQNEKRLCEQIFHDLGNNTVDSCFMDIVADHTNQLLETVEAFSCTRPASQRLFKILDLLDSYYGLIPEINKLFDKQSSEWLRIQASTQVLPKLADKMNENLTLFENSVVKEQSKVVHGEPIHQLSKYVMPNLYKLCDHKKTMMSFCLPNLPSTDAAGNQSENLGFEEENQFSDHVVWIITSLVSNLEVKAMHCEDPPVGHFFAMNNFRYIIQKIEGRLDLREIVGDEKFNELHEKFKHAKAEFLKLTLHVALRCLRNDGLSRNGILSFRVSRLTDRLMRFNGEFEKLGKRLGKLVVLDFGLALELCESIVGILVVAYSSFLLRVKNVGRLEMHVKYTAKGLESEIQKFFICNPNR